MAAITVQTVGAAGNGNVTFGASSTSDTVAVPGLRAGGYELQPVLLVVTNGDDATHAVTVGGADAVSVLAGDTAVIPLYSEGIGDTSITVTTDDATSQTVAAIRLTGS